MEGLKADEIITAMREDPLSQGYAYQRMREVVDNALIAESEQVIGNLRSENIMLREKVLIIEAKSTYSQDQDQRTEKKTKKEQ